MVDDLHTDTLKMAPLTTDDVAAGLHCLTIAYHPLVSRIGDRITLDALRIEGETVAVSRQEPSFGPPFSGRGEPLMNAFVSRRPFTLSAEANGAITLNTTQTSTKVSVNGAPAAPIVTVSDAQVRAGVVLEVSGQVVLVLNRMPSLLHGRPSDHGLVGASDAMQTLRRRIDQVASDEAPVLIRGETGSGKELVASAIHAASTRADRRLVTINMSAIPTGLASSELFGHARGAFSGAGAARDGLFVRADGGTLFLGEVGDTPAKLQPLLLRALETGESRPWEPTESARCLSS